MECIQDKKVPFEPDPIWQHFENGKSFEAFVGSYPAFSYHRDVPNEIRLHLDDIHAILIHSYFRYRFLDIAYARAMQVLEMALRVRHKELGSPKLTNAKKQKENATPYLRDLLSWVEQAGMVEETDDQPSWRTWDRKRTSVLGDLRNFAIHAEASALHGVSIVGMLYRVADFVNELYDDVELRKTRHEFERRLQRDLSQVCANGAILEVDNVRWITYRTEVLYATPIGNDWNIYLGVLKIFRPEPNERGEYALPEPIILKCRDYVADHGQVSLGTLEGTTVMLREIQDETNSERFKSFKSEFEKHPILFTAAIQPLADQRVLLKRHKTASS